MVRSCGPCAVLAGAIICWAGVAAVAQDGGEVMEDLGNSYVLARRTTSAGSIIETLLFAGQAIVTDIAVPGPDTGATASPAATAPVPSAPAGNANAARADANNENLPHDLGAEFGGTWLTGEIVDDYLILHRVRPRGPVTHEIFHDGHKVGFVAEVGTSVGAARSPGRNSFTFESSDDRFVVHLTQPDGTRIRATTEHGRFSSQVVERTAGATESPPGLARPTAPAAKSSRRSGRPQR